MSDELDNHGHSLAAWVLVGLVILGSAIGSLGVALVNWTVVAVGVVVIIIGLVAGKVLAARGHGIAGHVDAAGR